MNMIVFCLEINYKKTNYQICKEQIQPKSVNDHHQQLIPHHAEQLVTHLVVQYKLLVIKVRAGQLNSTQLMN